MPAKVPTGQRRSDDGTYVLVGTMLMGRLADMGARYLAKVLRKGPWARESVSVTGPPSAAIKVAVGVETSAGRAAVVVLY